MTGPLTLSGDPASNLQAATKQYVDEHVDELADELANELASKKVLLYNNNSLNEGDNYIPSFNMLQYQMLYAKGSVSYIVNAQSRESLNIYYRRESSNIHNIFYAERNTVGSKISNYESIAFVTYLREIVDEKNLIINNNIDEGIRIDNDGNVASNSLSIYLDYESQYYTITSASIEVYGIKL